MVPHSDAPANIGTCAPVNLNVVWRYPITVMWAQQTELGGLVEATAATESLRSGTRDRLLKVEEAAELLSMTPSALRYQLHRGTAPKSAKIMGRRVFRESDVLAFIDEQFEKEAG